ncbi:hypothetical protein QJS10_CPB20g00472 [Acorus calamus]|uniref:Neprosin PEP catalytic domain-containing protein n=1 Tax=Acorus calamus TaxID=4465 RepID=A0AAV9CCR2_ACOCL|nr:hypothetical protein QJS10_CPB20g00472 [Acorus calamus]
MKEIDRMLKVMNKPAIKTIKSVDGDIIDCVDIYKQPAFDHPLLRNHTIQMKPLSYPKGFEHAKNIVKSELHQPWHLNGTCPEGTIPIRRIQKSDLMRAASLENFGRKSAPGPVGGLRPNDGSVNDGHEHSIVIAKEKFYMGALASLNVWKPQLGFAHDFSLSQVWLSTNNAQSTIEVGWIVYPDLYNDDVPRIFTYWTGDRYASTGCYNLMCLGFIQTTSKVALGAALAFSVYGGEQVYLDVVVLQDKDKGIWYLQIGGELIGYWPGNIVPSLSDGAQTAQFGGEIYDKRAEMKIPGPPTATDMGSGHFPGEGLGRASTVSNIMLVDNESGLVELPHQVTTLASKPQCYDVAMGETTQSGFSFFFGGSGEEAADRVKAYADPSDAVADRARQRSIEGRRQQIGRAGVGVKSELAIVRFE